MGLVTMKISHERLHVTSFLLCKQNMPINSSYNEGRVVDAFISFKRRKNTIDLFGFVS